MRGHECGTNLKSIICEFSVTIKKGWEIVVKIFGVKRKKL